MSDKLRENLFYEQKNGYDIIDTAERIALLHENGITVNCWTVNDPMIAEDLVAMGVDYITTNILE